MTKRHNQFFNNDLRSNNAKLTFSSKETRKKAIDIINPFNDRGGPFNGGGRMGWA